MTTKSQQTGERKTKSRQGNVRLPLDPKDALRALLQVKPPEKDDKPSRKNAGKKKPSQSKD